MADDEYYELDGDDGGDFSDRTDDTDGSGVIEGDEAERMQGRRSKQSMHAAGRNYSSNRTPADGVYHSRTARDNAGRNYEGNEVNETKSQFQDDRPDVRFNLVGGDVDGVEFVGFKYKQPSVSVQTSANFATHDVFGDTTVRQKLGEKPDEISVDGICTADEANYVDNLVYEEVVELVSNRWSGVVHVASTSTDPIADGGGQDLDSEWIYSFTIECVEITETIDGDNELTPEGLLNLD